MMNLKSGRVCLEIDGRNTEETIYVMLNCLLINHMSTLKDERVANPTIQTMSVAYHTGRAD